ncbi:HAD-IIIA family hydrolase, partial [Streptomyces sp. ISL-66]|uniref:D-glycero-alpha-D-manno-heptose-1,7-bisphosphate 7-phosphatase n=1 Tax=Streptomyces sp. ISL-66 TaxID=2819186 RepID=UPI001BE6F461
MRSHRVAGTSPKDGPWLWESPGTARRSRYRSGKNGGLPEAVLFDRDGTLVVDVPYNGDPARVAPMPFARAAVSVLRGLGIPVGVVSNQSGVARGLLTQDQVESVRRRVDALFGPFDVWAVCPHGPESGCGCRKPAPGLVLAACERLGAAPGHTVVIGDIGADVRAARAAGARGVLVPTQTTRPEELAAAAESAADLLTAVRLLLPGRGRTPDRAPSDRPPDRPPSDRAPS